MYVHPFPNEGNTHTVSTQGGREPVWTRGGRELIYRNANRVLSVTVAQEPQFSLSAPKLLFEGRYVRARYPSGRQWYDVSSDGEHFIMVELAPESQPTKIHVVLKWFQELKQLAPADD